MLLMRLQKEVHQCCACAIHYMCRVCVLLSGYWRGLQAVPVPARARGIKCQLSIGKEI
jgi:hypothetical protein